MASKRKSTKTGVEYEPRPGLGAYLRSLSPKMHTSEMDMVLYWDWTRRPWWRKTVDDAWDDLGMLPRNAKDAIQKRIVPMEIYSRASTRSNERANKKKMPKLRR